MNNVNNRCNNEEEEEIKIIISSLLIDMIMKVLFTRQQHLVRRCRERKREKNTNEYVY
jgi:hypothetical protein